MASAFPVTLTFISICGMALLPLVSWIGLHRGKVRVLRGDGGDAVLFKRIRVHGNFIETAPLVALTLAAAEGLGLAPFWLWAGFASFFVGRILHYVLYDDRMRAIGMVLTTAPAMGWGIWTLVRLSAG